MAITGINDANNPTAIPATQITVASFETAGGTTIPAGTLQATLEAIADLADPSG